jgi:hypothetical protein
MGLLIKDLMDFMRGNNTTMSVWFVFIKLQYLKSLKYESIFKAVCFMHVDNLDIFISSTVPTKYANRNLHLAEEV